MYLVSNFSKTSFMYFKFQTACAVHFMRLAHQAPSALIFCLASFMMHTLPFYWTSPALNPDAYRHRFTLSQNFRKASTNPIKGGQNKPLFPVTNIEFIK